MAQQLSAVFKTYIEDQANISQVIQAISKQEFYPTIETIKAPNESNINQMVWSPFHKAYICACDQSQIFKLYLNKQQDRFEQLFIGLFDSNEDVKAAKLSNTMEYLAFGSSLGRIQLLRISDNINILATDTMDSAVETISFSRDDKWLVVTYVASALITVINIPSRTLTIKFNAETEVNCAFISPSGRSIVVAYRNILIYSRENGDLVRQIKSFGQYLISSMVYTKRHQIITANTNCTIHIINYKQGTKLHTLYGHNSEVHYLQLDSKEKYLLSADWNWNLKLWSLITFDIIISIPTYSEGIISIGINLDKNIFFTTEENQQIRVWNVLEFRPKPAPIVKVNKDDDMGGGLNNLVFNKDKSIAYATTETGMVYGFNLKQQTIITKFVAHYDSIILSMHYLGKKNQLVTVTSQDRIKVWRLQDNEEAFRISNEHSSGKSLVTESGNRLIVDGLENLHVWDLTKQVLVHTFEGHSKAVNSLSWLGAQTVQFLTSSQDETIRIWNAVKLEAVAVIRTQNIEIHNLITNRQGEMAVCSCFDYSIRLWNIENKLCDVVLHGHQGAIFDMLLFGDNDQFLFTSSADKTIGIWSIIESMLLTQIPCQQVITKMLYLGDKKEKKFYLVAQDCLCSMDNPLEINFPVIYPENSTVFAFRNYISRILNNKSVAFDPDFIQYLILPHRVNILHILTYCMKSRELRLAIKAGGQIIKASTGDTPLSIIITKKSTIMAEIFIKYVAKYITGSNPEQLHSMEHMLPELHTYNLPSLHKFYNAIFPKSKDLPMFGVMRKKSKIIIAKDISTINQDHFIKRKEEIQEFENDEPIQFRRSLIKFSLEPGCKAGIQFMESLLECNNLQIFKTELVDTILQYRWNRVKWVYLIQAIVYLIMMVLLTVHTVLLPTDVIIWGIMVGLNGLFLIYESIHIIKAARIYMSDFTNIFDILRVTLFMIYLVFIYAGVFDQLVIQSILSALTIIVWIRGVTYLRVFAKARRLIRITYEVFKDILLYLLLFVIFIFTSAVVFFVATDDNITFLYCMEKMYFLGFGRFSNEINQEIEWVIFIIASIMAPVFMLQFLIVLMTDTFDRIQEYIVAIDTKEFIIIILEAEQVVAWFKRGDEMHYLQSCEKHDKYAFNNSQWEGRFQSVKNGIDQVQEQCKYISKVDKRFALQEQNINKLVSGYKKLHSRLDAIDSKFEGLARLEDKIDRYFGQLSARIESPQPPRSDSRYQDYLEAKADKILGSMNSMKSDQSNQGIQRYGSRNSRRTRQPSRESRRNIVLIDS